VVNSDESYVDCQTHAAQVVALKGELFTAGVEDPWLLEEARARRFGEV